MQKPKVSLHSADVFYVQSSASEGLRQIGGVISTDFHTPPLQKIFDFPGRVRDVSIKYHIDRNLSMHQLPL